MCDLPCCKLALFMAYFVRKYQNKETPFFNIWNKEKLNWLLAKQEKVVLAKQVPPNSASVDSI